MNDEMLFAVGSGIFFLFLVGLYKAGMRGAVDKTIEVRKPNLKPTARVASRFELEPSRVRAE